MSLKKLPTSETHVLDLHSWAYRYVYGAVREGGAVQSTTLPKSILTSMQEVCIHINTDVFGHCYDPLPLCSRRTLS